MSAVDDALDDLLALARIPAPTFDEGERVAWLERRLADAQGRRSVDAVGNLIWRFGDGRPRLLVLAHVDTGYAMQILRMNVAALGSWLGPVPDPPRPAGPVVAWGTDRLDVFVTGYGGVLLHKSWDGTGWQPATAGYESLGSPG